MIKVFKFGGASIKDVQSIKNVGEILQKYDADSLVIIFSAIGKVTNMLEEVVEAYVLQNKKAVLVLQAVKDFHFAILKSFGFAGKEMASFYLSNSKWDQGDEIPVIMFHGVADSTVPFNEGYLFQNQFSLPWIYGSNLVYNKLDSLNIYGNKSIYNKYSKLYC